MEGMFFKDHQGFTYFFPDDMPGTMYIGCPGSDWCKLSIGEFTFSCGILTRKMYDNLRAECVDRGTFKI